MLDAEKSRDTDLNNDGFIGPKDVKVKDILISDKEHDQHGYLTKDNDIIGMERIRQR